MTADDKMQYREVKDAIRYGALFPADQGVKFSYNGKSFVMEDFYEPRACDISLVVDGQPIKQSVVKTVKSFFSGFFPKTHLEITVNGYKDSNSGSAKQEDSKTLTYKGVRERALLFLVYRNFGRLQ